MRMRVAGQGAPSCFRTRRSQRRCSRAYRLAGRLDREIQACQRRRERRAQRASTPRPTRCSTRCSVRPVSWDGRTTQVGDRPRPRALCEGRTRRPAVTGHSRLVRAPGGDPTAGHGCAQASAPWTYAGAVALVTRGRPPRRRAWQRLPVCWASPCCGMFLAAGPQPAGHLSLECTRVLWL